MNIGDEIPELVVEITRKDLVRYAGAANDYLPQHWDQAWMIGQGFNDVVVHGWLGCAHLCRAATMAFPPDHWSLARYAVRYRQPFYPGRAICGGKVVASENNEIEVSGWIADDRGATVTTANLYFVKLD